MSFENTVDRAGMRTEGEPLSGQRCFRAKGLPRNAQLVMLPGLLFVGLGIVALAVNAWLGLVARGIGVASICWAVYFVTAVGYIRLRMYSRIVVDNDRRTVSIVNTPMYGQQRTWSFDELELGRYRVESTESVIGEGFWLEGPDTRFRINALTLIYQSDNSGLYRYDDLPQPFSALSIELEEWRQESWMSALVRAAMPFLGSEPR